jgi:hypothetical protein
MHVQLTRKLANLVDGIDLAAAHEGDVLDLERREAELLIAEGWAVPIAASHELRGSNVAESGATAADTPRQSNEPLEKAREDMDSANAEPHAYQPTDDGGRATSHDEGPRTIPSRHPRHK